MDAEQKSKILQELGGLSEELYDSIVRDFIIQTRQQLEQLKVALTGLDFKSIALLSHAIKGSSGNLRIKPIYEAAIRLEQSAKSQSSGTITADLSLIESTIGELDKQFKI